MARAAVPGRLTWRVATVADTRDETATARTLVLDVPGWPGHLAGQHVDVKLTADDGYSAQRSYSIASAPREGRLELTVQRIADGEVSPYLTQIAEPGDQFELRGPIGGWFAWHGDSAVPLLLMAGGSGVVPLMSILRAALGDNSNKPLGRASASSASADTPAPALPAASPAASAAPPVHADNSKKPVRPAGPIRLVYSVRTPADVIYASELSELTGHSELSEHSGLTGATGLDVTYRYTREAPPGVRLGRIGPDAIRKAGGPVPGIFVCGPTGFVEAASSLLIAAGYPRPAIKTERFGPTR